MKYSISQFSKLTNLSPRMLRHYDKIDVLKPASIDSSSGYRYYSSNQIEIALRIDELKKYKFSLNEIKDILKGDYDYFKQMIKAKINELDISLNSDAKLLDEMEQILYSETEKHISKNDYSVLYGKFNSKIVFKVSGIISEDKIDFVVSKMYNFCIKNNLKPINTPFISFMSKYDNSEDSFLEIFLPLNLNKLEQSNLDFSLFKFKAEIINLPSHLVASTIHIGRYQNIGLAYKAIDDWVSNSTFKSTGFAYEIYLRSTESKVSESDFVTQICYEIEPK